ncbi:hypothetical protein [Pseudoroseomonas cervicalis]|uniref:hypothetical protein n=1 Tax=Teichococcus cervicalis TaxID=204525 RepID=UPI0027861709|nr:hypothetical protein [Pseudoroseomonas cervicalis]MDQ1079681.1 hypothetical protein [Pseudoroseomonas cervicalis]
MTMAKERRYVRLTAKAIQPIDRPNLRKNLWPQTFLALLPHSCLDGSRFKTGRSFVAKRSKAKSPLNDLSFEILELLRKEFTSSDRNTSDLLNGYVGPKLDNLAEEFIKNRSFSRVDYDLAIKSLEDHDFVDTGPKVFYENDPDSSAFILAMYSKREYIYLKEDGYRVSSERKANALHQESHQSVTINNSSFYQSPVGVGREVKQQLHFDIKNKSDIINYLSEILIQENIVITEEVQNDLNAMVEKAKAGDMAGAKPLYRKLFEKISGPGKELAMGVLTEIVKSSLGF